MMTTRLFDSNIHIFLDGIMHLSDEGQHRPDRIHQLSFPNSQTIPRRVTHGEMHSLASEKWIGNNKKKEGK